MKTESEQLWYTWSTRGFGGAGFQIRAASPGFQEGNNSVAPENEYIQALLAHARYVLPTNTKDSGDIPPQHLPVSLAFLKVLQEPVLLHKCYCPPDDGNTSGNFFSHVITDLPEIPSPAGPIAFTAREAIATWGSSYWKTRDELQATQKELPRVTFPSLQEPGTTTTESEKLRSGNLDRDNLKKLNREYLEFMLRAFLMRQPEQRIYVAAPPELVADLLWGLTHCLPRTLDSMRELTFSTYERLEMERTSPFYGRKEEDQSYPVITGTCWPGSSTSDLPAMYYQDQGVNGFALNCYSGRCTPLMPDGALARFVLFAVDCLLDENNHTYRELSEILKQAERERCQDLTHFMRVYISYQETLSQNDVQELISIIKQRLDNIVDEEKMLLADLERLQRPNVQSSILQWIARNRSWWENMCRQDLVSFFACLDKYAQYPLPSNIQHVIDTLHATMTELGARVAEQVNEALSTENTDYMYFWMDMLELTAPLQQSPHIWLILVQNMTADDLNVPLFQRWWQIKGESIFLTIHQNLKLPGNENLVTPLTPFGKNVVDKILAAILEEDRWSIDNWQEKLIKIANPRQDPAVWIYLFQQLVTRPYQPIYLEWWNAYGKHGAEELNLQGRQDSNVADKLYQLGELIIHNIVLLIEQADPLKGMQSSPNWPLWSIWNEMFSTLITLADTEVGACKTWLDLWGNLWPYVFTPVYEQWWQHQGAETSLVIRQCAEKHPQSEVAQNVADFIFESILPLAYDLVDLMLEQTEEAEQRDARNNLFIVLRVLLNAIPSHHQEEVWITADNEGGLLEYLTQTIQTNVDEIYPWEIHRTLLDTWAQVEALHTHPVLYSWLNVSWSTIGRLLAEEHLPASWQHMAVESVLHKPVSLEAPQLKNLLLADQSWQAFQYVLQQNIVSGESTSLALTFFQHLVEINHPHKSRVLGCLLLAARELPEVIQELLRLAQLTNEETATFLEQECQEVLQRPDWPATFTPVLYTYVTSLNASRLSEPAVLALLHRIQQLSQSGESEISTDVTTYVNGWLYIEKLLDQPTDSKRWIRLARPWLGQMLQLQPEARGALADLLWPILVHHLSSEMDLTRVLDNLGPALTGTTLEADAETGTALLLSMAPYMASDHQQQQDVRRLVPYLKIALEQAQETLYPKNEAFLLTFFKTLCGDLSSEECEQLDTHSELWSHDFREIWQTYIQQQREKSNARVLTTFQQAIQDEDVESITQAYQQVLKEVAYPGTQVNQQERDIALLAGDIVSAYKLMDQGALFQAHQEVQQSPYKDRIRYTPEIEHAIANLPEMPQSKAKATRPLLKHRNSQMLTKIAAQPNAEILKALEQSVQETNARTSIGTVQSKSIMLDQLNKIHAFKRLYLGYRLSILDGKIKNSPWNSKEKAYYKKEKKELQEYQRQNDQFLRKKALDDLIDNVFINSGIESRIKQGQCSIDEFLLEQRVLEQFRAFQPDDYMALIKMHSFTETDVKQVLRIFRRRERFAERLLKERDDLDNWLEERKKLYQDQIQIESHW